MPRGKVLLIGAAWWCCAVGAVEVQAQVSRPRAVALTGKPLDQVGGSSIGALGRPVVGSSGVIYFTGEYTSPGTGFRRALLYAPPRVGPALLFRQETDPVPELGGFPVVWGGLFALPAAQASDVLFTGSYGGGGIAGTGLWRSRGPLLSRMATNQAGSIAPGTTGTFGQFLWTSYAGVGGSFTSTAIRATVSGATTANSGIWVESWIQTSPALTLMAFEGSPPPGLPMDVQYDDMSALPEYDPAVNSAGMTAFLAPLRGNVTSANNRVIVCGLVGNPEIMARTGTAAPGMPAGATWATLSRPWLNSANAVFAGRVVGGGVSGNDDEGLWISSALSPAPELVVREGIEAPGIGGGILLKERSSGVPSFRNTIITGSNTIYFVSGLLGVGINNDNDGVIYRASRPMPGAAWQLTLVVREGQPAPGLVAGVDRYGPFGNLWANTRGEMAFTAQILGSSMWALFAGSPGTLRAVVVANRTIDVGLPGAPDIRTVTAFFSQFGPSISSGGGGGAGDGFPTCLSEAGTLVFRTEMTGGAGILEMFVRSPDFNGDGTVSVQDIFDFLQSYFEMAPAADFNSTGDHTPQDIFDFLDRFFASQPGGG